MDKNDPLVKVTVRLPRSLMEKAKIRAVRERTSLQALIEAGLAALLKTPLRREGGAE